MVSLKNCNYKEFLDTQPVDKSYLEELREKIAKGDSDSEKVFKKQINSLAAYIAQKYICEYIDMDYLFSHIDSRELELLSCTNLFFYFRDKDSHIRAFETEIQKVIDRLYIRTFNGKLIAKEYYEAIKKARKGGTPLDETKAPEFKKIPKRIIIAVNENEDQIEKEEALEAKRFSKLKHIIRDRLDLSYKEKLNILSYLMENKHERELYYCIYGIDDGVTKSLDETASDCGISTRIASDTFTRIKHKDMSLFSIVPMSKGCKRYTVSKDEQGIIDFLCENEQNKKEHDSYMEELKQNIPPARKRDFLRDYLD